MSIPDRLISQYFRSFADISQDEIGELDAFIASNPLEAKKQLASLIVGLETKDLADGLAQREHFERKFSERSINAEDCKELSGDPGALLIDCLNSVGVFSSKGEIKRLFEQKAIRLVAGEKETVLGLTATVADSQGIVRVGKRRYFKVCASAKEGA